MMRLGRPEHPASTEREAQPEEVTATEDTVTVKETPGRSTLLDRLKMLWSQKKEKDDHETKE